MTNVKKCDNCRHFRTEEYCKITCGIKDGSGWESRKSFTEVMPEVELPMEKTIDSINMIRTLGKEYCVTDGSNHYSEIRKDEGIDAIEIAIKNNVFEDFAITNIVKYALRFKKTRNKDDLKKIADYAHILCGVEINKEE